MSSFTMWTHVVRSHLLSALSDSCVNQMSRKTDQTEESSGVQRKITIITNQKVKSCVEVSRTTVSACLVSTEWKEQLMLFILVLFWGDQTFAHCESTSPQCETNPIHQRRNNQFPRDERRLIKFRHNGLLTAGAARIQYSCQRPLFSRRPRPGQTWWF